MQKRAEILASHLTLAHATTLSLTTESPAAIQTLASRASEISKDEAPTVWMQLLEQVVDMQVTATKRTTFAEILSTSHPEHYKSTIQLIWEETLDAGNKEDLWKFVTIPLATEAKQKICHQVASLLAGSKRDSMNAATVLYASQNDSTFDRLISSTVKQTMERWSKDTPDAEVTAKIAQAIGSSKDSRSAAQSIWKRRPINEKRLEAFKAAQRFLKP